MDRLLDEYLRTVASYLRNGPQRDDIITELSGHLQSKIEERRAGLDRPMTRVDEEAVLADYGDPLVVASRYGTVTRGLAFGRQLIGPELFPSYFRALALVFGLTILIVPAASLFADTLRLTMPLGLIGPMLAQFCIVTLIFAGLDSLGRRQNRRMSAEASHRRWRPSHLRAIPRWYSMSGIVAMTLLGLWWMALRAMPALLLGANAGQLGLSDRWDDFRVPILMLLLAGIVLRVVTLWRPNAAWLRYGGRLLINVLCLATLPYILKGYPLVVVADPRTAGVDARALALAASDWIWWILAAGFGSYWLINVVINSSLSVRYVRDVRHQGPESVSPTRRFTVLGLLLMAMVILPSCRGDADTPFDKLHPCAPEEGPPDASCGRLSVFEDPVAQSGRTLDLKIVVAPALRRDPRPDPLFVFEGGPGAGAATLARTRLPWFVRLQTDRDIVFVDLRGTGPDGLHCESAAPGDAPLAELVERPLGPLRSCLEELGADPRLYTTSLAVDDIEDVRRYLGYGKIDIWAMSYGTRAALTYLARHEGSVRSMVLDSVHPSDSRTPLHWPRDGQRALDRLIADCARNAACAGRFPNLGATVEAVLARADQASSLRLRDPHTGVSIEGPISRDFVASIIFGALYSTGGASILPQLLDDAAHGDFQGLVGLALGSDPPEEGASSEALFLSVLCSEDVARLTREQVVGEAMGTFLGPAAFDTAFRPCEFWPRAPIEPEFYEPVRSSVPALVLSGAEDPVAPPVWGEQVVSTLVNGRHIIVPGTGHVTTMRGCVPTLIRVFLETTDAATLDTSCLSKLGRPPIWTNRSGPGAS